MLEIVSLDNKKRWNEIIRSMNNYDFYHLAEYHQLDHSGTPLLLYYSDRTASFALPVILRTIENTGYKDITSVYGYSGPLSGQNATPADSIKNFQEELQVFFDSNQVVSVFARLHPLFTNQELILSCLGNVIDENQTVGIDLTLPEEEQRRQYSHSLKNAVNRLKRKNLIIKKAQSRREIDSFVEVYWENMKRVNAASSYFFSSEYFHQFLESIDSSLLLAYYDDEIISGSLFTECNSIIQPHLSATKNKYLYLSPLKYIWDQIRTTGVEKRLKYIHLGGGFGGKNDTLFGFKSQFSHLRFMFKTWRYIHSRTVYDSLVQQRFGENIPDNRFFPLYRL
jgi:hypothetical protein